MLRTGDTLENARIATPDQGSVGTAGRPVRNGTVRVFKDVVSGRTFDGPGLRLFGLFDGFGARLGAVWARRSPRQSAPGATPKPANAVRRGSLPSTGSCSSWTPTP